MNRIAARQSLAAAIACAALAAGALAAASSRAQSADTDPARIAEVGTGAVQPCAKCHGPAGQGDPAHKAPRLAGLDAGYMAAQLEAFASGARKNADMQPVATSLTPTLRTLMTGYYASLPEAAVSAPADTARAEAGKTLAETGDWSVQAPACAACHGSQATGVGSVTPPLRGQTQTYLLDQLKAFRSGDRKGDPLGIMSGVAHRLSMSQLEDAAAYYAGLPLTPPPAQEAAK